MKAILFFLSCVILGVAVAQDASTVVASWSGNTINATGTFKIPVNNPCNEASNPTNYVLFNHTFTTSGVREVVALAESGFKSFIVIAIYTGAFNPAASCDNAVRILVNSIYGGSVLVVDDPVYFQASTPYYFVIASSSETINGNFAVEVIGSVYSGSNNNATLTWDPSNKNSGECALYPNVTQAVSVFSWQNSVAGLYDISGLFDAPPTLGISSSMYFSFYLGNFSAQQVAAGPCNGSLPAALITSAVGVRVAPALGILLAANTPYTIALSNAYSGNWGFQSIPTRLTVVHPNNFTQPQLTFPPCNASPSNNAPWAVIPILATGPVFILETATIPSYQSGWLDFDTFAFAYDGVANTTGTTPPSACPASAQLIATANTGNSTGPLVFATRPGTAYTVVISSASGAALPTPPALNTWGAYVYAFTGSNGGSPTTTTTTTSTTSTISTSGTTAVSTTSTSGHVSTTTSNTTAHITTSSSASTLVLSAFLLTAGAIALLL